MQRQSLAAAAGGTPASAGATATSVGVSGKPLKLQRPAVRLQQQDEHQQQHQLEEQSIPLLSLSSLSPQLQLLVKQRQAQPNPARNAPLLPHPLCELDPGALTKRIKACSSWRDAAVLFAQQAPCLNHVNLSALLVQLAHLPESGGSSVSSRPANWQPFVQQVLVTSQPMLQFAQPRQLANMAWALAKLGLAEWVDALLMSPHTLMTSSSSSSSSHQQMMHQQQSISQQQQQQQQQRDAYSNSWASGGAAAAWGCTWQQEVLHSLHSATCRDVSNMLWALATSSSSSNRQAAARGWPGAAAAAAPSHQQQQQQQRHQLLQELMSALHRTLPTSTPQDVANALWALARLNLQPSQELLSFLLIRVQAHAADLKPCEVATTLWALSRFCGGQQHKAAAASFAAAAAGRGVSGVSGVSGVGVGGIPSSLLRELLLRQVGRQQWQDTRLRHWVMCLVACAHLGQVPPSAWLNECLQHLQDNMLAQANSTQQQQQLDTEVQQQHCDMQQQSQPVGTSGAATNAGDADSTTSSISSDSSLDTLSSSSSNPSSQQCCLSSQDLSNTIWALATLRIKPHSAWMSGYLSAGAATLSDATPQELTNSMWGLQVLGVLPDAGWLSAFDAASLQQMAHFTPQGLGDVLAAQVRLGLKPSWVWCEAWAGALKASWGFADASAVCKTLWAAAKCQVPLGRAWLSDALQRVHEPVLLPALAAQEVSPEELLRLMWAVGRLCRGILSQELSNVLGLYCCRAAGKMSGVQLARGAWGLARLVPLPREGTLSYFHDLAESKLGYVTEQDAGVLREKLALLRDAAAKADQFGTNWRARMSLLNKQQGVEGGVEEGVGEEGGGGGVVGDEQQKQQEQVQMHDEEVLEYQIGTRVREFSGEQAVVAPSASSAA